MNRPLAGAAAAAILLPAGIVAVMLAAPANAEEPPGPPPSAPSAQAADAASPEMLDAMQRDLGLTETGARERIAKDDAAGRTGRSLRKKLGSSYGGAWLTPDAKSLVVAVTDPAEAAEVTAAGATPKLVSHSAAQLDALKAGLDKAAAKAPAATVPGWYVDAKTNTIVVQARGNTAAAKAFIKASGVDTDAVRVVSTTEQPRTYDGDIRGGDVYFLDGGNCSIGLSVRGVDEKGKETDGFISAGHCGKKDVETFGHDGTPQGFVTASSFPGNDYLAVRANGKWKAQPWVKNGTGGNVIVAGGATAAIGSAVCRSGSNTGWRCGVVHSYNQTANYAEGPVTGLTRTTACAGPGDSGGAVLSGQQAQGVVSGGAGDCGAGGVSYVQPLDEILQKLDLTLVVSDERPPANPLPNRGDECPEFKLSASGKLTEGGSIFVPNNTANYYYSKVDGLHSACLNSPARANFDLTLQKWEGGKWTDVASGEADAADESVNFRGTPGYYTWKVIARQGEGSFTVGYAHP
jgi:streptogrisin C